jgi:hypothetical protein
LVDERVRAILIKSSGHPEHFASQLVGLQRAMVHGADIGLAPQHRWSLSPEAYDYSPEPVFQHVVLCVLNGLWFDASAEERRPEAFAPICVRQTAAWSLSPVRAEPTAVDSAIGWIKMPFAWDDAAQLTAEGFLNAMPAVSRTSLLGVARSNSRLDDDPAAWVEAHPQWNGLIAKAAAGACGILAINEGAAVKLLLDSVPELKGGRLHQSGSDNLPLARALGHQALVYTVAHETGHILVERWGIVSQLAPDGRPTIALEQKADELALRSLWNYNGATLPHIAGNDTEAIMWLASGLFFYLMLILQENGQRVISENMAATAQQLTLRPALDDLKQRLTSFVDTACAMVDRLPEPERQTLEHALPVAMQLMPLVIACCNAYLSHCRTVMPAAIRAFADPAFSALRVSRPA